MSGRKAYRAFYEETSRLQRDLKKLANDFRMKEVHQFRVIYKKLRAILRVAVNKGGGGGKLHLGKGLKCFYHTTGSIRNYQLQKQRIRSICADLYLPEPLSYFDFIDTELNSLFTKASAEISSVKIGKLRRNMKSRLAAWNDSNTIVFFQTQLSQYQHLTLDKMPSDENMHRLRKILKDLLYTSFLLPASGSINKDYQVEFIERVTARLGDYHDLCMASQLLDQAMLDNSLVSNHKLTLCYIKDILSHSRKIMKEEIVKTVSGNASANFLHNDELFDSKETAGATALIH